MSPAEVDDQRRVAAILAYDAVRKPPREDLQGLVDLAARLAGVPHAGVEILTDTESHQVVTTGFEGSVRPLGESPCASVLADAQPVVVHAPRCYVAHPLVTRDGVVVGALTVSGDEPRALGEDQLEGLATLAARVVDVFELRLRTRELALSTMEIQAVQAELDRSNERLPSFAGQVSHDLKTPLTTLSLTLSLIREQLEDGQVGSESVALLDRAINSTARMADLIDDVLDYARLGGNLKATEVDLDFVLGKVLEDLAPDLADATLHISELPTVLGDRAQLGAVLQNLLANAARYRSGERPLEVRIGARHVQRAWRIEITDNGRGVPPAERQRVFEPLARVDDSIEGSGIGLATCRRIVGAHGGRIGVDPTVTEGARFWFELPD